MKNEYTTLLSQCESIISQEDKALETLLTEICTLLQKEVKHYDWVGFYFADHMAQTLHLKAFAGIPTDHTEIPFGKGICGQVAVSNENFIVEDVTAQDNYIACDIQVKSEIVIPLFVDKINVGQIDIDSNIKNAFSQEDATFLEQLNARIADILF